MCKNYTESTEFDKESTENYEESDEPLKNCCNRYVRSKNDVESAENKLKSTAFL
jgi:hypothetical protein